MLKLVRQPPTEIQHFSQRIGAFIKWLSAESPAAFQRIWPAGHFEYSEASGRELPQLLARWQSQQNQ
ncbi:MAG: hypothetical protein ACE5HS_18075 [bacterium]